VNSRTVLNSRRCRRQKSTDAVLAIAAPLLILDPLDAAADAGDRPCRRRCRLSPLLTLALGPGARTGCASRVICGLGVRGRGIAAGGLVPFLLC